MQPSSEVGVPDPLQRQSLYIGGTTPLPNNTAPASSIPSGCFSVDVHTLLDIAALRGYEPYDRNIRGRANERLLLL
jgi:hypothetical protein